MDEQQNIATIITAIAAELMENVSAASLNPLNVQPGMNIAYGENGDKRSGCVYMVSVYWRKWKINVVNLKTGNREIAPLSSIDEPLSAEFKTEVRRGDKYIINVIKNGNVIMGNAIGTVLAQSSLEENSAVYFTVDNSDYVCSAKLTGVRGHKSLEKSLMPS